MEKELEQFIEGLRSSNSDEIGVIVVLATHLRHTLEQDLQTSLLFPAAANLAKPDLTLFLNRTISELQRKGAQPLAAGVMVWLHSSRAMSLVASPRLRNLGREMWDELERGFIHVPLATMTVMSMLRDTLEVDVEDAMLRPEGLERKGTR